MTIEDYQNFAMEPPHKRQRLSPSSVSDPDLQKRRARNDHRLKSIFESIFDKYGKDFDGVGDEIDLRTGEIVVNNGHILGMTDESDIGQLGDPYEDVENETSSEEEEGDRQDLDEDAAAPLSGSDFDIGHDNGIENHIQGTANQPLASQSLSSTFERSLHGQIIDYESEEDELADSAIEWITPREARAISHQKWQLPSEGPVFIDKPNIEKAWRAPPLPGDIPTSLGVQNLLPDTNLNELSISLKASVGKKPQGSGVAESPKLPRSGNKQESNKISPDQQDSRPPNITSWDHPTTACASEKSNSAQESLDGSFRPHSQNVKASALPGKCNAVARSLNKDVHLATANGQHRRNGAPLPTAHSELIEGGVAVQRKLCIDQLSRQVHVIASQPLEDDAPIRKDSCIDQLEKQARTAISFDGLFEQQEHVMQQEPQCYIIPDYSANAGWSASKVTNPMAGEQAKDVIASAAITPEGKRESAVPAMPTLKVALKLPKSVQLEKAEKAGGVPSAAWTRQSHLVKVLIPPFKSDKPCERGTAVSNVAGEVVLSSSVQKPGTGQEVVRPDSNERDRKSSPSIEASADVEVVQDVEIPDSQPECSSPMVVNNNNTSVEVSHPRSLIESARLDGLIETQHENRMAARDLIPDSEFDDELSIVTIRTKSHFTKSLTPADPLLMRAAPTKILAYQARKIRNSGATKTAIRDSSSLPSDVLDSSEDELA